MINGVKTVLRKVSTTILSVLPSLVTFALTFIGGTFIANSQNLDSLPQSQRDSILISTAKEAVLRYGPGYYREYKEPVIERVQTPPKGTLNPTGENAGRICYRVTFLYDTVKERLGHDFAAIVLVWEDIGKPYIVSFPTGYGRFISEDEWASNAVVEQTPYQTMIFPIYDWQNHPEKKEPVNIDELRRKGYEEVDGGQWVQTKREVPPNIDILKREGYEEINGQWVKTKKKVPARVK
jgi:hypothetical protein